VYVVVTQCFITMFVMTEKNERNFKNRLLFCASRGGGPSFQSSIKSNDAARELAHHVLLLTVKRRCFAFFFSEDIKNINNYC
jgi:hypothetical protein